jgi:hypothetical protein
MECGGRFPKSSWYYQKVKGLKIFFKAILA